MEQDFLDFRKIARRQFEGFSKTIDKLRSGLEIFTYKRFANDAQQCESGDSADESMIQELDS